MKIDQYLAGGEMPYQVIIVDLFPSSEALLRAFEALSAEREQAFSQIYALAVRPNEKLPKIAKSFRFLAPILREILGTNAEKEITRFDEFSNHETSPIPETIAEMREHDQNTPFYMMNLNKYYPRAQYANGEALSGKEAYDRYSSWIAPFLISVGGYPDIFGDAAGVLVGDKTSPLHDDWSDFAMVYYPSRKNFLNMMTHSPKKSVHHRSAGLQRAVLMPSSSISSE